MDHQEKYIHDGPQYPQGSDPQYQMQAQPQPYPPAGMHHQAPQQSQAIPREAYGQQGGEWQASLCDCSPCSSCLLAWCLPCLLLGQTSERIRDPSMQTADMMNSDCMIHGAISCFTGCGWIYAMLKRTEIRERYNIEGSGCGDCCVSFWCPCCALIQQDNEVKLRQSKAQPIAQAYQSPQGMHMPAPAYTPQH
ncbi:PLAC8-domain-containing protein [Daldinia caldariorum]|uniref:PLAC8-domain-containing protein n=1 Tax=Daldinia caldariorum TaxID=326644 RepID=UPI00200838E4|nr:PLAC8-domain-containing protein [Daldinia caldariorum]KAI1470926.1 PLAC8-domain-containing protein [Daldinia caldariorum]